MHHRLSAYLAFALSVVSLSVQAEAPAGFAVVELFTSQGCSSCPPADRVLAELDADAQQTGKRVFILSHHVDYWNRLGWTDPFSTAEASDRQRHYAAWFRSNRIYTPQMIVNGRVEFVGSNQTRANEAVSAALEEPATVEIVVGEPQRDGDTVRVSITLSDQPIPDDLRLLVALAQHGLSNHVPRGENRGRQLTHEGVVRGMTNQPAHAGDQEAILTLPERADDANFRLVAFVQSQTTGRILGAAMRPVPPPADR